MSFESGIFDKNKAQVKVGDTVLFYYVDPMGKLTDEIDFEKTIEFKYGCFGYSDDTEFTPLMEWMIKEKGDYVPNCGNKTVYTEIYAFEIKND